MSIYDQLSASISTYHYATGIGTAILDEEGNELTCFNNSCGYCTLFREKTGDYCPCLSSHRDSGLLATELGDCYIFACPAGLYHFSVAVTSGGTYMGSVLAGPILLNYPDISDVDEVLQKYNISLNDRPAFFTAMSGIPVVESQRARYLGKLLFFLVYNLLAETDWAARRQETLRQQAKIGEYLGLISDDTDLTATQYKQENELISYVLDGNVAESQRLLNEVIGNIFFSSGNNLEIIKIRTIELMGLLSRSVIRAGVSVSEAYDMVNEYQLNSLNATDLTELSYTLLDVLRKFIDMVFYNAKTSNSALINKAFIYIGRNYKNRITLEEIAAHVALSPSYFSSLFKEETGMNYSAYVTNLRVGKAKKLLKETSMALIDVALELGFDNQQYFSHVFKKSTDMTPRQYRMQLK